MVKRGRQDRCGASLGLEAQRRHEVKGVEGQRRGDEGQSICPSI